MQNNTNAHDNLHNSLSQSTGGPGFSSRVTVADAVEGVVPDTSLKPTLVVIGGPGNSPRVNDASTLSESPSTNAHHDKLSFPSPPVSPNVKPQIPITASLPSSSSKSGSTLLVTTPLRQSLSSTKLAKSWERWRERWRNSLTTTL